jgi:Alpha-L-fucosidase
MTRRDFIGGAAATLATGCVTSGLGTKAASDAALAAAKRWFKEAQFGMMAHFGLYSMLGGEWKGRKARHTYGEWIQHSEQIPQVEYSALAKAFNPILFDPLDWMKRARDAGMKYFVITSKHHDGFALFRSKVSNYNVVDATPFKRDIVDEIAEACRTVGIKLGLYYSQDLDWSDPNGGGRLVDGDWPYGRHPWGNFWDWKDISRYDFDKYLREKSLPQVEEILTQYGDLCLIWFDVPMTLSRDQSESFVRLVRKHQPGCLISGRIGNGLGDYETPGDNAIADNTDPKKLYETVGTMNDSWGYRPTDTHYKSVKEILAIKAKCASIGSNYMLNVGPDPLGRFPAAAIDILDGLAT